MLSPQFQRVLAPARKSLLTLWGAFLAACFIYAFLAWTITRQGREPERALEREYLVIATLLAVVILAVSFIVERIMLAPGRLEPHVKHGAPFSSLTPQAGGTFSGSGSPELARLFGELAATEQHLAGLKNPYQTTQIVVWGLREIVAVMGLVLVILGADFMTMLPFAAVALVTIALQRPRLDAFLESNLDLARKFA